MEERLTQYFTLKELIASDVAAARGIDNTPSFEVAQHLLILTQRLLDPMREAWGSALVVSSGYRCKKLNSAVGGVPNSAHLTGWAADIRPSDSRRTAKFILWVTGWLADNHIAFDQAIDERSGGARWLHISLYDNEGRQRRQNIVMSV